MRFEDLQGPSGPAVGPQARIVPPEQDDRGFFTSGRPRAAMARAIWLAAALLSVGAAGCLEEPAEPSTFAVVTVDGRIVEEGEARQESVCGRPLWSAGLATEDRQLTVLEHRVPNGTIQIALWDDVVQVHAGNWTACEWPILSLSTEDAWTWTAAHRNLERSFELRRSGETLTVGNETLTAGEDWTVEVDENPEGSSYTYTGQLEFTFHGFWPSEQLVTVASEDGVRGAIGVVAPER